MSKNSYIIVRTAQGTTKHYSNHADQISLPVVINGNTLSPTIIDCSSMHDFLISNKKVAIAKANRLNNLYPEYHYSVWTIRATITEKVGG